MQMLTKDDVENARKEIERKKKKKELIIGFIIFILFCTVFCFVISYIEVIVSENTMRQFREAINEIFTQK